jgi:hypothetical protein
MLGPPLVNPDGTMLHPQDIARVLGPCLAAWPSAIALHAAERPIGLSVDATEALRRRLFRTRLVISRPGPLALYDPKLSWASTGHPGWKTAAVALRRPRPACLPCLQPRELSAALERRSELLNGPRHEFPGRIC